MFRAFRTSKPSEERLKEGSDLLVVAILQHRKSKHQTASATTVMEIRHDVFNYIFRGGGRPSTKSGCILSEKNDFNCCSFFKECNDWNIYTGNLGDGTQVVFPIRTKALVSLAPQTHKLVEGKLVPKPRYHLEKIRSWKTIFNHAELMVKFIANTEFIE